MNRIEFNPNDTRKVLVHESKSIKKEVKEAKEQLNTKDNE